MSTSAYIISNISPTERAVLVERFQSGETGVFDEIVCRYRDHVYRLAYGFTHNREDAYDISQEVFLKVFRSLGGLKKSSTFHAWLRQITVNACIDHLRQRPSEYASDALSQMAYIYAAGSYSNSPDGPLAAGELGIVIRKAVDQLPKRQKKVFMLRHYEDLSLKEVAQTLECPLGTVKANLFHATRRLRELLLPYVS